MRPPIPIFGVAALVADGGGAGGTVVAAGVPHPRRWDSRRDPDNRSNTAAPLRRRCDEAGKRGG